MCDDHDRVSTVDKIVNYSESVEDSMSYSHLPAGDILRFMEVVASYFWSMLTNSDVV